MTYRARRALALFLAFVAALCVWALVWLAQAPRAEAATFTFVTTTKQMGRDYCWNLYRGQVVSVRYIGAGYYQNTCVGRVAE